MREIKFRAWSKESEVMFTNEILKNAANGMIKISKEALIKQGLNEAASNLQCGIFLPTEDKDLVFMQYTGIEDKNGNEIYEGDIVKAYISYSDYLIGEVKHGKFEYSACDEHFCERYGYHIDEKWEDYQSNTGYPIQDSNILEVIGNIYENEDLLEK